MKIEEKILYSRIKNKDRQAFVKAYDLYVDQIYRFIYFKVGNKEEAEDLSSAVFLKIWSYLQENNIIDSKTLRPLLYKIARNIIIDHYRKINQRENVSLDKTMEQGGLIDVKQDIAQRAEVMSDLMVIETKLPELKEEYREVIIMRYINELSIKEIAEI
ncbi:sigma-70 family RNA polymerase sigma factor, partial [Candidatus Falkowbacteria bacterium]|nr:sigma-70 family RNA polymerase sigma factor [Candidatus Falkowbacteria bacterium]